MGFDIAYYGRFNERIFVTTPGTVGSGSGAISNIINTNLAPNWMLVSDSAGKIIVSGVSATEGSFLIGVSSPIQTQFSGKEPTLTKGNLTESNSNILTITGGTSSVIGAGVSIQVKQAATAQSGYLSSTDWNTFNGKLSSSLNAGYVFIGNGSNIATATNSATGDILANSSTGLTIKNSVVSNIHIANAAAITRTKLATGNAYRILANDASGVISENASLTGSRAIISDPNGQLSFSATTSVQVGYLSTTTSDVQVQMNTKIASRNTSSIVQNPTITQNLWAIMWDNTANQYILADPILQGIPAGGTTRQFLGKNSATIYDSSWLSLVTTDISDITASAAQINVLSTGFYDATTSVQTQLDLKLDKTLNQNYIFVGDASNHAVGLASGANTYVLTSVSGVPTWVAPSGGISGLTTNRIPYATSSSTLGDDSALTWDATNNALTIGNARIYTVGTDNIFVGTTAGNFTTSATRNIGIGTSSLNGITTGNNNVGIGYQALLANLVGISNVAIGDSSLLAVTANSNIGIGASSGILITSGAGNICIGAVAGANITTGSDNVTIGRNISAQSATNSNQLSIQNIIFGTGNSATGTTASSGNIGIGGAPVADKFEIWHSGSQFFGFTSDGRLYGKALHNNAGSITGTSNQYIASGTYTPTLTNTTNVTSSTAFLIQWIRVGNAVTVSGMVTIQATSAAFTVLNMSLPIASNFGNLQECAGTHNQSAGTENPGVIYANIAGDNAEFAFQAVSTSALNRLFSFTYLII